MNINMLWQQFREWCIKKAIDADSNPTPIEDLVWVEKDLGEGKPVYWGMVDTVDFNIAKLKTRRRIILETEEEEMNQERVREICQNIAK